MVNRKVRLPSGGVISDSAHYFMAAAKHEHLSRAAEELSVSQPALSRSIARLEAEWNVQLFDRVGRGVRLSPAGKVLLRHLRAAIGELENAAETIEEQRAGAARTIAIGFLASLGVALIPTLIRGFTEGCAAGPSFKLLQGPLPLLLEQLHNRAIHLCISGPRFSDTSIEWRPLYKEELVVVVAATHPLAHRGEIDLVEIAHEPLIALKQNYGLRQVSDEACREAGFTPVLAFEAEEIATMRGLAGAGVGVTIAPATVKEPSGHTVDLRIRSPECRRTIGLSWRADRHLPTQTREFRDYVIEHFATTAG